MKNIYSIVILLVLFSINIFSQDKTRGFKFLKKKKYLKSEKFFSKILTKEPEDVSSSLGLAQVYSVLEYEKKDLFKSYKMVKIAEENFEKLNKVNKRKIKDYVSENIIQDTKNDIDDKLYEFITKENKRRIMEKFLTNCLDSKYYQDILNIRASKDYLTVKSHNTIEAYDKFVKKYKNFNKIEEARTQMYKLAFEKAKKIHNEKTYNEFLKNYADAPQIFLVKKLRNELVFENAKLYNSINSYEEFIDKYPEANEIMKAKILRDKLAFNEVKQINSINSYDGFIKKYIEAKQVNLAKKLRNELAFEYAKNIHTIKSYNFFIDTYPNAIQINKVKKLKEKLAYEPAKSSNTAASFNDYMKINPQGKKYKAAFNFKANLLSKKLAEKEKNLVKNTWMKIFDKEKKNEVASFISKNSKNDILLSCNIEEENKTNSWIIKLNKDANLIWDRIFEENDANKIFSICEKNNEVFTAGEKNGKIWITKLNQKGEMIFEKIFENGHSIDIKITKYNKIILLSQNEKITKISKLENDGEIIWEKNFENLGIAKKLKIFENNFFVLCEKNLIKLDEKGKIIFDINLSEKTNDFLIKKNMFFLVGEKENDFLIMRLDKKGIIKWKKVYDKDGKKDIANAVIFIKNNEIVVSGTTENKKNENNIWMLTINYQGGKMKEKVFSTQKNDKKPFLIPAEKTGFIMLNSSGKIKNDIILTKFYE